MVLTEANIEHRSEPDLAVRDFGPVFMYYLEVLLAPLASTNKTVQFANNAEWSKKVSCNVFVMTTSNSDQLLTFITRDTAENFQYKKGKGVCKLFMEIHLTATECHLPYGITVWDMVINEIAPRPKC